MKTVVCLEDGKEYRVSAGSGFDAMRKMLYTLNLTQEDKSTRLILCNGRTWSLVHQGKTYGCIA